MPSPSRLPIRTAGRRLLVVLALTLALGACRRQPAATPEPAAPPAPRLTRVAVVDLSAVAQAHPRWPELQALNTQIQRVESELAVGPVAPPVPELRTDIGAVLEAEAKRLRAEFEQELAALRAESARRLDDFAATLRAEQQARFDATRKQLEADGLKTLEAKQAELRVQLRAAEREIFEEYRYPLLNLRLRAEVAGLRSEEEAREVLRQIQALQAEREERLRAKAEEMQKAFEEFQKVTEQELNTKLKRLQEQLSAEAAERLAARQREVEAELVAQAKSREDTLRQRLERRRRQLIAAAEAQLRARQRALAQQLGARGQQLQAQLRALREQRVRLEDGILADVKIEVATIAQDRGLDVILTRYIARANLADITADVVARLKR